MRNEISYCRKIDMDVSYVITESLERLVKLGWVASKRLPIKNMQQQKLKDSDSYKPIPMVKFYTIEKGKTKVYVQFGSWPLFEGIGYVIESLPENKQRIRYIEYDNTNLEESINNIVKTLENFI